MPGGSTADLSELMVEVVWAVGSSLPPWERTAGAWARFVRPDHTEGCRNSWLELKCPPFSPSGLVFSAPLSTSCLHSCCETVQQMRL